MQKAHMIALIATLASFTMLIIGVIAQRTPQQKQESSTAQALFRSDGLATNTTKATIPLSEVLDGGPGKDGIPAITAPHFTSVENARSWLSDEGRGILFAGASGTIRFYPYAILYWHEIVNDVVDGVPIAVTFCPLCGTAIVFDRRVSGETLAFGVSGKLYQSNLLMYDTTTESLWSQARGRAVVGDFTGTKLPLIHSNLVTFGDVRNAHPDAMILSRDTGYRRNYARAPYGDYEENEDLIFPTEDFDARFHPKELFVVAPLDNETALGFHFAHLREAHTATLTSDTARYTARIADDGTITITNPDGTILPHYITMYFSWSIHDNRAKIIWER